MAKKQNIDDLISRLEEKEKESTIIYADEETEQVVIFELSGHIFAFPGKNGGGYIVSKIERLREPMQKVSTLFCGKSF